MTDLPTLTKFDARVFLRVSKNTIDRMMKRGELPYFKRGRRVFFSEEDLRSVYKRKEAKGANNQQRLSPDHSCPGE